jgi:hypothetical protein
MPNSNSSSSGGISLLGLIFVVFLVLKLAEIGTVATWSWWWVTSPLWLPFAVAIPVLFLVLLVKGIAEISRPKRGRW